MPEYLTPGVYIEEIEIGPKSIEGVSTSTAAFVGETERGPLNPTLVTGLEQYRRVHGSYSWTRQDGSDSNSFMRHALEGFFANGGKRCFVARIVGEGAMIAAWPDPADPDKVEAAKKTLAEAKAAFDDRTSAAQTLKTQADADPDNAGKRRDADRAEVARARAETALRDAEAGLDAAMAGGGAAGAKRGGFNISALGPGVWGNRVEVSVARATLSEGPAEVSEKRSQLFKLTVAYKSHQEIYDNLSSEPGDTNYIEKRVNGYSSLITVTPGAKPLPTPAADKPGRCELHGGTDGQVIKLSDYQGNEEVGKRTGLSALAEVDEISIVCAPNENDVGGLTGALITHCENLKDRFAVLQAPNLQFDIAKLYPPGDSKYAAYYYPWIKIIDGGTGVSRLIPPGGHVSGIYARTDIERGVHKAPANEVVRGAIGTEFNLTVGEQDILNPRGVNCIRAFLGRGIRVWGARTISSDPSWKYVNVRRLFLYLEESIEQGTQWVVFEPNDQRLWARVKQSAADFLTTVWRNGALMGNTAEEAFFVKCDETTMTQNDLDNGRLIVVIGVAPVKPAEFVIFRIAQWTRGTEVTV
jgi:uncharacterized protein